MVMLIKLSLIDTLICRLPAAAMGYSKIVLQWQQNIYNMAAFANTTPLTDVQ
jgi:hypothetical protein